MENHEDQPLPWEVDRAVAMFLNAVEMDAVALRYARRVPSSMPLGILISQKLLDTIVGWNVPIDRALEDRGVTRIPVESTGSMINTVIDGKVRELLFLVVWRGES